LPATVCVQVLRICEFREYLPLPACSVGGIRGRRPGSEGGADSPLTNVTGKQARRGQRAAPVHVDSALRFQTWLVSVDPLC
jgi:hypothetical protein